MLPDIEERSQLPNITSSAASSSGEFLANKKRKRMNVIESDDDDSNSVTTADIDTNKKLKPLNNKKASFGSFENSFKDLNESIEIKDSQESPRTGIARKRGSIKPRTPLVEIRLNTQNVQSNKLSKNKDDTLKKMDTDLSVSLLAEDENAVVLPETEQVECFFFIHSVHDVSISGHLLETNSNLNVLYRLHTKDWRYVKLFVSHFACSNHFQLSIRFSFNQF